MCITACRVPGVQLRSSELRQEILPAISSAPTSIKKKIFCHYVVEAMWLLLKVFLPHRLADNTSVVAFNRSLVSWLSWNLDVEFSLDSWSAFSFFSFFFFFWAHFVCAAVLSDQEEAVSDGLFLSSHWPLFRHWWRASLGAGGWWWAGSVSTGFSWCN